MKNNEIHTWDRGYDDDGNQVRFCSLICYKLYYLHEYLTALVSVEIKAKKKTLMVVFLFYLVQVWGVKEGPYEFKSVPASSFNDMLSPLNFPLQQSIEKRIEGSFVLED